MEATTTAGAHCEFFQPGEIFQLDTPLSSSVVESSGRQFDSLFGDGDRFLVGNGGVPPSLGWRRAIMTGGLDSASNSSSSDDDNNNNDEDSRMEFEQMVVHSGGYPDIYNGATISPPMGFNEYNSHSAKLNHHPHYHQHSPAPVSYAHPPPPVIMNNSAKYPLNPPADLYLGLLTTDGAREQQSATWKCANSGASPSSSPPPPYPHLQSATTSKYRDLSEMQDSRTFEKHSAKEEEAFRQPYSTMPPGRDLAPKYAEFGEALLL